MGNGSLNAEERKQLLTLLGRILSPEELVECLSVLRAKSEAIATKTPGKQAQTLAFWGTASRTLKATVTDLREILRV